MKRITLAILALITTLFLNAKERYYKIVSLSGKIETEINVGSGVNYGIRLDGRTILEQSPVSMTLSDGRI